MNCTRTQELFADYLDDRLAVAQKVEFERHFARCANCPALFDDYREIVRSLEALTSPTPAAELESRVLAAVLPRLAARTDLFPLPSWRTITAWAAAASLAMLFIGVPASSRSQARLGKEVSQTTRRIYSFGVRAYRESERLVDELNVLRMTVGVAFEDQIDELNERLRALEELQKSRTPSEQSKRGGHSEVVSAPIGKRSHL